MFIIQLMVWFVPIFMVVAVVVKGYKLISSLSLKSLIYSFGDNLSDEKVERFIKLVKKASITNHPKEWNRLRAGFQIVNQSPNVSYEMKRHLMNALLSKGLNLGNIRIIENESERKRLKEQKRKVSGEEGEKETRYCLNWLPSDQYKVLHNVRIPHLIEPQEFDHIVICPYAIFHLESKNYGGEQGGNISISMEGVWSLKKYNNIYGIENPLQQVNRNDRVLKDYIAKEFPEIRIPVQGVVVITNKNTTIEGVKNTPLTVLKVDMLNYFIENYNKEMKAEDKEIESLFRELSKHVEKKEKAV